LEQLFVLGFSLDILFKNIIEILPLMKNYFFMLFLLISSLIWSQDATRIQYQKDNFESAKEILKYGDNVLSIRRFLLTASIVPKSEIAQIAIKKTDSIKLIIRNNKINQLIGNWKWIPQDANWVIRDDGLVGKMITINPTEILFFELYKKSKKWELVKKEILHFSEKPELYSFTELVYSNKEIWDYTINKESGELNAFYIGEENEWGFSQWVCGQLEFHYFKLE
jgi:hypothetical protein